MPWRTAHRRGGVFYQRMDPAAHKSAPMFVNGRLIHRQAKEGNWEFPVAGVNSYKSRLPGIHVPHNPLMSRQLSHKRHMAQLRTMGAADPKLRADFNSLPPREQYDFMKRLGILRWYNDHARNKHKLTAYRVGAGGPRKPASAAQLANRAAFAARARARKGTGVGRKRKVSFLG